MNTCQLCSAPTNLLLDFGPQPICNRYLLTPRPDEFRHSLSLVQCRLDGLLQLGQPWPSDEIRPRLDWITYKEPERHLDDLCQRILKLPDIYPQALVVGLSYKDEPVLSRLKKLGFTNTWNVSLADLGLDILGAGMESIQSVLSPELAASLRAKRGVPAVIVVRHLLEHSNSIRRTLDFLKAWGGDSSYFILEVPDSEQTFADLDFGTIWEEHVCYFTEYTLGRAFAPFQTDLLEIVRYPYTLEDCLVAVVANRPPSAPLLADKDGLARQLQLGKAFQEGWRPLRKSCQSILEQIVHQGRTACVFGAGHRATTFINLLGLAPFIEAIIDDDPRKAGLFLPGNQLPIKPSAYLLEKRPAFCLLAASPDSEKSIIDKNRSYLDAGGSFASIYPRSSLAWLPLKR